jgi:hypothetical protein
MRHPAVLLVVLASLFTAVSPAPISAQDNAAQALALIGGSGGTAFTRQCPQGQVLSGIRARAGLVIDALGIKCRPVNADGSLGGENEIGSLAGGTGGILSSGSCPQGSVVAGQGGARGIPTGLGFFELRCRRWDPATRRWTGSITAYVRVISGSGAPKIIFATSPNSTINETADCSRAVQPAVLLRGRAGTIIDAAGFTCNEP